MLYNRRLESRCAPRCKTTSRLIPARGPARWQILMGSVGATASGPHMSPRVRQSVSDVQSWIGPIGVEGHGPSWQLVVIMMVAQQTSLPGH